jgi:hypothetical protein
MVKEACGLSLDIAAIIASRRKAAAVIPWLRRLPIGKYPPSDCAWITERGARSEREVKGEQLGAA